VAVVFGIGKKAVKSSVWRGRIIEAQKKAGKQVIVLETGYINRGEGFEHHYAAGFNDMNGKADFRNANSPPDRVTVEMKKWRVYGDHILLCGQVPWDSSVQNTDHRQWLNDVSQRLIQLTDRPIIFRPHPLAPRFDLPLTISSAGKTIEQDLENAWAHISYNSNTGVDAVLAGVPTFAFDDYSMVRSIANGDLDYIESPQTPDRQQWLNDISYSQWTMDEMRSGATWNHLYANSTCEA
jgi:hypothetical protein